ncbi:hypothetical protein MKZ38_008336 [Zalerion maritima]|uniref:Uncharacterized protein n=1 Tax=Zalerion maritima TaxID=339359 RepID=A0AAD5WNM9_9PEZI|nr:hypothetical protein MKZ38_008336 [Zalerion maritima]
MWVHPEIHLKVQVHNGSFLTPKERQHMRHYHYLAFGSITSLWPALAGIICGCCWDNVLDTVKHIHGIVRQQMRNPIRRAALTFNFDNPSEPWLETCRLALILPTVEHIAPSLWTLATRIPACFEPLPIEGFGRLKSIVPCCPRSDEEGPGLISTPVHRWARMETGQAAVLWQATMKSHCQALQGRTEVDFDAALQDLPHWSRSQSGIAPTVNHVFDIKRPTSWPSFHPSIHPPILSVVEQLRGLSLAAFLSSRHRSCGGAVTKGAHVVDSNGSASQDNKGTCVAFEAASGSEVSTRQGQHTTPPTVDIGYASHRD